MAFRFRKDSIKGFKKVGYVVGLQFDEEFLEPREGFPPIKTKEYPESVWDEALWPPSCSKDRPRRLIMKGQAKRKFLLTDRDMEDLVYIPDNRGEYPSKKFLYTQVERRGWEKYGGPSGLKAAAKAKASKGSKGRPVVDGGTATKNGGGLKKREAHAPPSMPRNGKPPSAHTAMSSPSVTSAAAPAVRTQENIPSTPRKHGNLVRLHSQPGLSSPAYSVQDDVAGPSTPKHARISARQSLSGPSSLLTTPTRNVSSQNQDDYRSPTSAIDALDSFATRSPTSSPVKRRRESEPGPSTPRFKRQRCIWIDEDDDEPPPRTPTPPSSPVKGKAPSTSLLSPVKRKTPHTPKRSSPPTTCREEKAQDDVLELTGSEDDYVPSKLISPKKSKSFSPAKKGFTLIHDGEVIEISD